MKPLIVHPDMTYYGGAELVIVRLAQYLHMHGIEHGLLTTGISDAVKNEIPGTEIIIVPPKWRKKFQTGVAVAFQSYLMTHPEWDVINIHNYPAELAIGKLTRPVVWMCNEPPLFHLQSTGHGLGELSKRAILALDNWIVRNSIDITVVADQFNANRFRNLYGKDPIIIPYGIDCEFFSSGNGNIAHGQFAPNNRFILLQVGIISPLKNQMESIRCVDALKSDIPNILLILAGKDDESYKLILEKYISTHNLENHVYFSGHVSREEIRDLYHVCDVAIYPVHEQGSWLSPFEALCAHRLIIVSEEFTVKEIIRNEGIGIVTNALSDVIRDIHQNPGKYSGIGDMGATWTQQNLSWERFGNRMLKVFEDATSHNSRGSRLTAPETK